ncbi:MAG: PQQ-dependent sugar dehydrogenase [Chitinophagaceae bacterium]
MKITIHLATALLLSLLFCVVSAQPPDISFQSQNLTEVLSPVDIINAGDGTDRMFIVEQGGIIRVWDRIIGETPPVFMDMGPAGLNLLATGGEQGLLSMAFHPDYDGILNRFFFVYYTNTGGNIEVARFQTVIGDPNTGDGSTFASVIIIPHPGESNHNGGKLNFGPDGFLYFATGDGGGTDDPDNSAQDGASLLGKMLRIDINATSIYGNYAVPEDNPFVGDLNVDERIYALGLRNPFRWSFDRANGNMWIGDVGQSALEEVNFLPAGSTAGVNYGWRCYEGMEPNPNPLVTPCSPPGQILPIFDYPNPEEGQAITGGYVYRGTEYPAFRGYYVAADYISENIFVLWPNGIGGWNDDIQDGTQNIAGFGEAEDGTLYAVGNNDVFKVAAAGGTPLPVRMISFSARKLSGQNELRWVTGMELNTARFHIEYSQDGQTYNRAGVVLASRIETGSSYSFLHSISSAKNIYYRLAIEDDDRSVQYSSIINVPGDKDKGRIYPTQVRDQNLNLSIPDPASRFQLVNSSGIVVYDKQLNNTAGAITVTLPVLAKGIYIARVIMRDNVLQEKIFVE